MADFGASTFGLLNVKDVLISNASQIEANIGIRAFDSARRLSKFVIEDSSTNGVGHISSNSFFKLRHLETVKLGKSIMFTNHIMYLLLSRKQLCTLAISFLCKPDEADNSRV